MQMETVLQLPIRNEGETAGERLAQILNESAYLLQASRDSDDPDVREAAIDLALRSLKAASLALEPAERPAHRRPPGRVVQGPWAQSKRS
jgi:hypothetical protein